MKPRIVKFDISGLNNFVKGLDESGRFRVKVGILGNKVNRKEPGPNTNADIGFKHEFGSYTENVPMRSFLRMPLQDKGEEIVQNVYNQGILEILAQGKIRQVFQWIGVACETVIGHAFETAGFGNWKPLTPYTIEHKIQHNPQPLIDTRQLQRAITSRVEAKGES